MLNLQNNIFIFCPRSPSANKSISNMAKSFPLVTDSIFEGNCKAYMTSSLLIV